MSNMEFPGMLERFFRYVKIDTQSNEESTEFPSTPKQMNLLNKLKEELEELGLEEVTLTKWGYVLGTLKTNQDKDVPTIALIGHVDTSPDVSGENVNPRVHRDYDGKDIVLSEDASVIIKVEENPYLKEKIGKTIITADGTTLLGADDKAGITEMMCALKYLLENPDIPRPNIRVLFTPDEEIGRGTEHITLEEIKANYGYTVDGEKLGEIEDETFCADTVEIKIQGVNVHPGYAKNKLVNAIKIGVEIIDRFPKDGMSPETTEKREGYIHPHHFSGGSEQAMIKILIRDFEEKGLKKKEDFIKNIVDAVAENYPKAKIDFKVIQSYRNMKLVLDKHPQVLEKAFKAVELSGIKPSKNIIRGGTDGARLSYMGLPTPNIFTGGANFHSRQEWIALEDMQKAAEVIVNLVKLWAE
ncbi:MAG: peptidase T [Candidatus Aminicenantes bacterium]|nr:MAG: peptidase T [Candidatus Aminicenantes bacterium]